MKLEFFNYVRKFEIFIFLETWILEKNYMHFDKYFVGFKLFWKEAELTRGCPSGGMCIGIKKCVNFNCNFVLENNIPMLSVSDKRRDILMKIIPIYLCFSKWDWDFNAMS